MCFFLLFFKQGIRKKSAKKPEDIKEDKATERPDPGRKWQASRLAVALGLSG